MTFWSKRKVLVTGNSGLIGKPVVNMLLIAGANVIGMDLDLRSSNIRTYPADITDFRKVEHVINTEEPEAIIHLAGNSGVESSRSNPKECYEANVRGTWNILEAARMQGRVEAVVITSSNNVYGKQSKGPTTETAPLNQLDTYSVSKIAADYIARSYSHNYRLPTAIIRSTNCYGPDDPHISHIIPSTILSVLSGDSPIIRGDGKTRKGYLYVDDVARAFIMITAALLQQDIESGEAWNVATTPISVKSLVNNIIALMGQRGTIKPVILGGDNDQSNQNLSSQKIRDAVGWEPQPMIAGLKATIEGFKERQKVAV
jgi:CDP-glucose 4,6-dehydratase|tara:strand:- start:5614 stop:6558 length:945 start_codon:yes stop_codon:yes gene_type:complete